MMTAAVKCNPRECPELADRVEALFTLSMTTVLSLLVKLD